MSDINPGSAEGASGNSSAPPAANDGTAAKDHGDSTAPPEQKEKFQPRPDLLQALMNMGIEKEIAVKALRHNHTAESAISWIYENQDSDDISESSDEEEDEVYHKMVFVLNSQLNMGLGKKCAQVAHAALGLFKLMCEEQDKYGEMLLHWEQYGETKIVLKGESTDQLIGLSALASQLDLPNYLVQDAGRTQIAAGSVTVLGIMGRADRVDQVTGSLKLL